MTKQRLSDKKNKNFKNIPRGRRIPVCFCIDTSLSINLIIDDTNSKPTGQTAIVEGQEGELVTGGLSIKDELNQQLEYFYQQFGHEFSRNPGVEIALVTFDEIARIQQLFTSFQSLDKIPRVHAQGVESRLAEGLEAAVELLENRKSYYKSEVKPYYQPFLIVMSDGDIDIDDPDFQRMKDRIVKETAATKLNLIICSFTEEIAPALLALQEGNEKLRARKPQYGNDIFTTKNKADIAAFFNYLTQTLGNGE